MVLRQIKTTPHNSEMFVIQKTTSKIHDHCNPQKTQSHFLTKNYCLTK